MRWEVRTSYRGNNNHTDSSARESTRNQMVGDAEDRDDNNIAGTVVGSNPTPPILLNTQKVIFSQNDLKRKIRIPTALTSELAEDIGIQIGDGSVLFYKEPDGDSEYRIQCVGNAPEDEEYLKNFVIPLKHKLFNLKFSFKKIKNANYYRVHARSKALLSFYEQTVGLPIGNKFKTLQIPEIIFNSKKEILAACIRGIADTDFSLTFKKKHKKFHYYPIIHLGCSSKVLIRQIKKALHLFGISSYAHYDYEYYDKRTQKYYIKHDLFISGEKNLEKWMQIINFHNPVHITKYLIWKKFGFCPPKITLIQRLKILEGKLDPHKFEN